MKIVVCNIGSSSFKYQLIEMTDESVLARGATERVGMENARVRYWIGGEERFDEELPLPGQREAVEHAMQFLQQAEGSPVTDLKEIDGIGFKTIQAGEKNGSVLLSQDVLDAMEYYRDLATAHNPPYLAAIYMFRDLLPETPLVGVFEPGFHSGVPAHAKIYGTPWDWIDKYGVKKYGYHGASHRFVTHETVKVLGLPKDDHKVITCHLGGSSSLCAFKNGESIDTTMGFTPQTGLIQGARIGDLDPFILPYIMEKKGITLEEALRECSKEAGLKGLSGVSADMRDIKEAIDGGNERAKLARDKYIYDIKRYIGEYLVILGGCDAITFTGGIGQKDAELREEVLSSLSFMHVAIDSEKNEAHEQIITASGSAITGVVLDTNEELVVARETARVTGSRQQL